MKFFLICATLLVFASIGEAKRFTKCQLVKELQRLGIAKANIPDWICLVQAESNFNSGVIGKKNKDGSFDYGLFQINDKFWCKVGTPGGDCKIDCKKLLNDDITDDVACANKIFKRHRFNAWNGWKSSCKNQRLPSISEC